ncbi:MAG: hypothetical protein M1838_005625 [Thelocarpon superellum]|nr:MAG: hypothetical protein M1838_005625 [Thelocarpon superellum]
MNGRRLLDLAALVNASRGVARQHLALRSSQVDLYTKTSSLTKAIQREPSPRTQDLSSQTTRIPASSHPPHTQAKATSPIPSTTADPPSDEAAPDGHDADVFYHRPAPASSNVSSQPPVRVPKITEESQADDGPVNTEQINAEEYYSSVASSERKAESEGGPTPEDVNTDVFYSPRTSKLLGGKQKPSDLEIEYRFKLGQDTPPETTRVLRTEGVTPRPATTEKPSKPESGEVKREEVKELAAAVARDVESATRSEDTGAPKDRSRVIPYQMHESRVPSSRLGRLWQYGELATGMAFGAVSESVRRATGGAPADTGGSLMLSAGNMDRLVAKLSRMRGAALKLGQMMSFQDSKMLPAPIQEVLQRVQDRADYMPAWQRDQVLTDNLGSSWRDLFSSFDDVPMAAASIGQVHGAVLASTGQRVAVKVQYPGVANSIDSDLSNLALLLNASRLLPKGLYLDKTIANARTELAWECDYEREAQCGRRFRDLLHDDADVFVVPRIIGEASGQQVLTMERMEGMGVTKMQHLSQEQRDWIGTQILRLCLREITEFHFMQTDPNWTNFLFNAETQRLELLDFGASREYPPDFIQPYIRLLEAASRGDREACRELSIQLGYLTGHETTAMLNAHISSVLTLAEPFASPRGQGKGNEGKDEGVEEEELYDFANQSITERVKALIPVMIRERLAPPPEETYSLHRKLSGAFLLCARLGSRVPCRALFRDALGRAGQEVVPQEIG